LIGDDLRQPIEECPHRRRKVAGREASGGDACDAIATFTDEALSVTVTHLESIPDASFCEFEHRDADGEDLFGASWRPKTARSVQAWHQNPEVADQLEARPSERTEHLVFGFFKETQEVAKPDDAGGVGIGPMNAHVDSEVVAHVLHCRELCL